MNKKLLPICVLMIVPLFMSYALAADVIPGFPHHFYGDVTVNGGSASDGITVTAEIDGTEVASTTTSGGTYDHLVVKDPYNNRAGDTISFFVEGVNTGQTAIFQNGKHDQIDFAVTTSSGTPPSSGGGGGGGGGGGSYVPPGTTEDTTDNGEPEDTGDSDIPPIPQPINQPPEEVITGETEDTGTTNEPTIISRITGAFIGTFSNAQNAFVGILVIAFIIVGAWFASKKVKKNKPEEN